MSSASSVETPTCTGGRRLDGMSHPETPMEAQEGSGPGGYGGFLCTVCGATADPLSLGSTVSSPTEEPAEEGLAAKTVAELRELAEAQDVELPARARKDEIIEALEEAAAATEPATTMEETTP